MADKSQALDKMKRAADAAAGRIKADVVLKNAKYLDVFCAEVREGDIAICDGKIVGIGSYSGEEEYDFGGKIALPGLIDSHMHIESTQLSPEEFAALSVPHGTTVVIADPHEIVNVCGLAGADYIRRAAARTPLEVKLMLPSCVPATPFETSGAVLNSEDTARALRGDKFFGLGEMMNYPAVAAGDKEVLAKLLAAKLAGKPADGHAPVMSGRELNAYVVSGARTDHECATAEEAEEKVSRGMYVLLRQGSASHDIANLAPAVNDRNFRRFALCTDDRHADGLAAEGHIDHVLRTAVKSGIKGEIAAVMCTLNAAECYGLHGKGAIALGYDADIALFDDLEHFNCSAVFKNGKLVVKDGKPLFKGRMALPAAVRNTVHVAPVSADSFTIKLKGTRARAIGLTPGTLVTRNVTVDVESRGGDVVLEDKVRVGAYCVLKDTVVRRGTEILPFTHSDGAEVGEDSRVGPYSRLRPGARLAGENHIGNFVEIKKSSVGLQSKINHLSYVGDAEVGARVNIGAGTITCNYDGVNKFKTVIGDDAFIGSDTQLVAPVTVGAGATLGAGTTLTRNAPEGKLTLSRARQMTVEHWVRPKKKE